MKNRMLALLILLLSTATFADPYQDLAKLPKDCPLVMAFDIKPEYVPFLFENLEEIPAQEELHIQLLPYFHKQEFLRGRVSAYDSGFLIDLEIGEPSAFLKEVDMIVERLGIWKKEEPLDSGLKIYKTGSQTAIVDTERRRFLLGENKNLKSYQSPSSKLAEHPQYQNFPFQNKAKNYVIYLRTDHLVSFPEDLLKLMRESPRQEFKRVLEISKQTPSFPDLAVASNGGAPLLLEWDSTRTSQGTRTALRHKLELYEGLNRNLSLPERLTYMLGPKLFEIAEQMDDQAGQPKSGSAVPLKMMLKKVFR